MADLDVNELLEEPKVIGYMTEPKPARELTVRDYAMWSLAAGRYAFKHARDGGRSETAVRKEYEIAAKRFNEARYFFDAVGDEQYIKYAKMLRKGAKSLSLNYTHPVPKMYPRIIGGGKQAIGKLTQDAFTISLEKPEATAKKFMDMVVELIEYDAIERNGRSMPSNGLWVKSRGNAERYIMSDKAVTIPVSVGLPDAPSYEGGRPAERTNAAGYKAGNAGGVVLGDRTSGLNIYAMRKAEAEKERRRAEAKANDAAKRLLNSRSETEIEKAIKRGKGKITSAV